MTSLFPNPRDSERRDGASLIPFSFPESPSIIGKMDLRIGSTMALSYIKGRDFSIVLPSGFAI
jgi:hypothetical protein